LTIISVKSYRNVKTVTFLSLLFFSETKNFDREYPIFYFQLICKEKKSTKNFIYRSLCRENDFIMLQLQIN